MARPGMSFRPRAGATRPAGWRPPPWRDRATYLDRDRWRCLARRAVVHVPVAAAIVFFFVRFALLSVQVQDAYAAPGFDLGIFDQGTWLLSRFHAPFVTVMGRDLFGDHTSFVLLLAVPLYWIWPEAQTLIVLQAFLLAAAAVPIYLLALRRLGRVWAATALVLAYLLDPALQRGSLEAAGPFHPESFLVLFLAVALYAAIEWRPRLLVASAIGCLLVKEDVALLVVPLAAWVFWRRDRRLAVGLAAGALAYAVFAREVVIRLLLGTTSFYTDRIPFGGISGLVAAPFAHTAKFVAYVKSGYRPFYVWQTGAAFGWAFLLAPEVAAIGILTLAENTLSSFPYMQQIQYHYALSLVPVLAMGTVYAISRLQQSRLRNAATCYVVAVSLVACWLWGLAPFSRHPTFPHSDPNGPVVAAVNRALEAVPAHAEVSAAYPYVSHLDHRRYCYQWPTPFRATYWYLYTQEGQTLPFAGKIQYLVIPSQLTGDDATTFAKIASQFRLVAAGGGVSVYRRVAPAAPAAPAAHGAG